MIRRVAASGCRTIPLRRLHTETRLASLGHVLPPVGKPKGHYVPAVTSGSLIFTAGHLPQKLDGSLVTGKVGADLTTEEGYDAAKLCALSLLATLKAELGDLDRVARIVKVVGFVNCADGFEAQPSVINGASELLGEVLEARGIHARSAVGTSALPLNVAVEVECVVEFWPEQ